MQKKLFENPKITVIYDTAIKELKGKDKLESIIIENVKTHEINEIQVDGLFYGLGLKPNTYLFNDILKLDDEGYIMKFPYKNFETMTSINGVFVAGDVNDKIYRQAIVAAGDGCKAALDANNYLTEYEN